MITGEQTKAVAQAFADALDRNDLESVATMLSPTCQYDLARASFTPEGTLVGPAAIVSSYRWHNERAHKLFDRVEYSSVIEHVEGTTAVVRFVDIINKAGVSHTYSCLQRISVNDSGLIESIIQEDIPEQVAAIRAFMERVGIDTRELG